MCMAVILGNGVESGGWSQQLEDCWCDVAVESLPVVNRPTQALRDTGNSVLAFTRSQLGVVEVGMPGQRLELLGGGAQCMAVTRQGSSGVSIGPRASQMGVPQGFHPASSVDSAAAVRPRTIQQMEGQGPCPAPSVGRFAAVNPRPVQQMGVPPGLALVPSAGSVAAESPRTAQQMEGQGLCPAPSVGRFAAVDPRATQMGVPQGLSPVPSVGSAAAGMVKGDLLKFHEEIWLSGAVNLLRGEPNCAPARWARKLEEQSKKYRIIFGPGGCPMAIFTVPGGGGVVVEQVKEVPAPSRRIALVAEAHELGHFGAEKTARRLWDLGFDWVGLTQDCEVITSVCRPCARDNAHRSR